MNTKTARLEQIRESLGLSKTEMAARMWIDQSYYQHIIAGKGKGNLRLEHIERLVATSGVNPSWLLMGDGERFVRIYNKIEWEKEPTAEQIEALYQSVVSKEIELTKIQSLKMQLACAQCYIDNPDAKNVADLVAAARVYLKIILRFPSFDINGLFGL